MTRAALYIRVSSAEQVHGYSLDVQEAACLELAEREGWDVVEVYRDAGESAKTTDRPELQRLLVDAPGLDVVVVYDLSRLSRDTFDHLAIRRHLAEHGVRLRAATQNLDETEEGEFVETVLAATNRLENALRRRKVLAGMKEALARGRWVWTAPLGYRSRQSDDGREKWMEPDPDVAPLLRWAFEEAARGLVSKAEVHAELGRRGLSIPRATLYRLLQNPIYAGRLVVPSWGVDAPGAHEPLVDLETFRAAARAVRERRGYVSGATEVFPFRQVTRCAGCGRALAGYLARGKSGRRWPYYRCQRCRVNVAARRLEARFAVLLDGLAAPPRLLDALELVVADVTAQRAAKLRERAAVAARRLAGERGRLEQLTDAFIYREALPEPEYRRRRQELERRIGDLEAEAQAVEHHPVGFEPALRYARAMLETPLLLWDRLDPARRPVFLRGVFPAGLEWEPEGKFRTPAKCLMRLPLQDFDGPEVSGGTPSEANLEVLAGWLVAMESLRGSLTEVGAGY